MKKTLLAVLLMVFGSILALQARDNYSHDVTTLPQAAREIIKKQFKAGVSVIKIDKDFGRVSEYEVILTDGTEVTFDSKGNWESVETSVNKSVPSYFVLKEIQTYVSKNHAGQKITGIEKKRNGFEVELSNGIDMKFDKAGTFTGYDD